MDNVDNVENIEQENDPNRIQDLIKSSLEDDFNHANKIFGEVMTIKMTDLLDQEKVKMAGQVFNGEPEEDEDLNATPEDEEETEEVEETEEETPEEEDDEEETEIEGAAV